jgi:hypothetical protein
MKVSPRAAGKSDQRRRRAVIAQAGIRKWSVALDNVRFKFDDNGVLPSGKAMHIKRKNAVYDTGRIVRYYVGTGG